MSITDQAYKTLSAYRNYRLAVKRQEKMGVIHRRLLSCLKDEELDKYRELESEVMMEVEGYDF